MSINKPSQNEIKRVLSRLFEYLFTGIIFAVIASLLTTFTLENFDSNKEIRSQLKNISNVYIGCNKAWADESFGTPEFVSSKDSYTLCAYVSDYFVLQIAFDESESACAYIVTSLSSEKNHKVIIDNKTFTGTDKFSNLALGDFTYYNFPSAPINIIGWASNGTGRYIYVEEYYFNSNGSYYDYYIASLDYGICTDTLELDHYEEGTIIDDEVTVELNDTGLRLKNRSAGCPNSFGVSAIAFETFEELLLTYDWFDSQQLRNKHQPDSVS